MRYVFCNIIIYRFLFLCNFAYCVFLRAGPYDDVHLLPVFDFGYYSNSSYIEKLFSENDIKIVVEVGSWMGGGIHQAFR
jgi:hypothetical protein